MSNTGKEQFEVTLHYVTQTPKALCVALDEDAEEVWLPKFDRNGDEQLTWILKGETVTLWAPEDLLVDRGLV